MSFACLSDRGLCPMDGRCPACTTARLRDIERLLERELQRHKLEVSALDWALGQIERHVLRETAGDLRVAAFASAVRAKRDSDPGLLSLLDGPVNA